MCVNNGCIEGVICLVTIPLLSNSQQLKGFVCYQRIISRMYVTAGVDGEVFDTFLVDGRIQAVAFEGKQRVVTPVDIKDTRVPLLQSSS